MNSGNDLGARIANKQLELEAAKIGSNQTAVTECLNDHKSVLSTVENFKKEIDVLEETDESRKTYQYLLGLAVKERKCLEILAQLHSLDELFGTLTNDVAQKSVSLSENLHYGSCTDCPDYLGPSAISAYQNCTMSVKNNWEWLSTLMKCSEIHMNHASDYHQFHHSVHELSHWMPVDLEKAKELLNVSQVKTKVHGNTMHKLILEIKTALTIFLRWHARMDTLLHQAQNLVPVRLRTSRINHPRPAFLLADYQTKNIDLQNGEEVTILDNSKIQMWEVRDMKGKEFDVPSVILTIPGPDEDALHKAIRLVLEFLSVWTNMVKKYGKTIILFLLHVIKVWTPTEEALLVNLPSQEKQEVRKLLDYIEKTFSPYWDAYPPYIELEKRINHMRSLLNQSGTNGSSRGHGSLLVVQTQLLEELLSNYREFWKYWENYKVLTERIKHPECLLSVSDWKQYNFLQVADWLKVWQTSLDLDESDYDQYGRSVVEEQINEQINLERTKEAAVTSQMFSSEQEENQTFVITGVVDPITGEQVSLDQAVEKGIINQKEGRYITNVKTGESIPIPVAMNAGKIKVELVTVKKSQEKIKDLGVITIKIIKEMRPYTLKGVRHPQNYNILSTEEATKLGILNQKTNSFKDPVTGNVISLADALDSGLLVVDFLADVAAHSKPVIESKTYVVNAIIDQKTQKTHTFSEAVRAGLVNPDNGSYHDSLTGKDIYIGDAIKEGFVKAIIVNDPSQLDVDPSNKISIGEDKMQFFKQALLNLNR